MDLKEAVTAARAGDEAGFRTLYDGTYTSKYHLALRYMKDDQAAQDVLQDAYIKAFSNLSSLEDPEAFPAWLGRIVANTAKNALQKKDPLLFSEAGPADDGTDFEAQIADEDLDLQPALSFEQNETRAMVREMLDSLSDEQRLCMLMFYMEERSVREIAQSLDCSENTVKSRLNYGRKNLRIRAEEMQREDYRLYGVSPIGLFLYLLDLDNAAIPAPKIPLSTLLPHDVAASAGSAAHTAGTGGTTHTAGTGSATQTAGAGSAAKSASAGLLHTTAGKAICAILIAGCIAGGLGFYFVNQKDRPADTQQEASINEEEDLLAARKEAAYAAYLDYLQEHSDTLTAKEIEVTGEGSQVTGQKKSIAFCDVTGDKVPEMICVDTDYREDGIWLYANERLRVVTAGEDNEVHELLFIDNWNPPAASGGHNVLFTKADTGDLISYQAGGDISWGEGYTVYVYDADRDALLPQSTIHRTKDQTEGAENITYTRTTYAETGEEQETTDISESEFTETAEALTKDRGADLLYSNDAYKEIGIGADGFTAMTYDEALAFLQ